jgi:Fe2+ or Zn2+ uptake regulation protein
MQMIRTAKELLISKGLEATPARVQILALCMSSELPLDVNSVADKIGTKAHLATVYRNLEMFVAARILERIDFQEGKFRYEYLRSHHHHAVCTICGSVEDVKDTTTEVKAIEDRVHKESGFTVTKHMIELFGLCNKCQKKGQHAK